MIHLTSRLRPVQVALAATALLIVLAGLHPSNGTAARTIFVDAAAGGANNGTTWGDAYRDLQAALGAASSGDQVWVAEGVYRPHANDRTVSFVIPSGVAVYGGFVGGESNPGERLSPELHPTVLSGEIAGAGATDNSFHVVVLPPAASAATRLDGFTVSGGYANDTTPNDAGAGIVVHGGSPTLQSLLITRNYADDVGGGAVLDGTPILQDVTVRANQAGGDGGGLYASSGSSIQMRGITLDDNTASSRGGGMFIDTADVLFEGGLVRGNVADQGGGIATSLTGSALQMYTAQVSGNSAAAGGGAWLGGTYTAWEVGFAGNRAASGGGIYSAGVPDIATGSFVGNVVTASGAAIFLVSGAGTITNSTFSRNFATLNGGAIYNEGATTAIRNDILWGNVPDQAYDDVLGGKLSFQRNVVQNGCPAVVTCANATTITADPKLGLPELAFGGRIVPPLKLGSSAIDTADPATCPGRDFRAVFRPVDGDKDGTSTCDVGAYEFVPAEPRVRFAAPASAAPESKDGFVTVALSTTAVTEVKVAYRVTGGTATRAKDFVLANGILTIPALKLSARIPIDIVNDRFDEPNETIVIELSAPEHAALGGPAIHTYSVQDDDPRTLCRGRIPTIIGTDGNDTLNGTKGPDVIAGMGGNDTISGGGGDDVICGGAGHDNAGGGNGNDVLVGDAGNDQLKGERGSDLLFGNAGNDALAGGASPNDGCNGGPGRDSLLPAAGCESKAGVP